MINRPQIFDLRPGGSLIEFLLKEGFDVFLVDWGVPDEEDADMGSRITFATSCTGLCARHCARAARPSSRWSAGVFGATLCAMYCGLEQPDDSRAALSGEAVTPVRNLVLADDADRRSRLTLRDVGRG